MVGHHFVVAVRKLRASPVASLANVLTLAIGLVCFLTAYAGVVFWGSGDARYLRAERVVAIAQRFDRPGGEVSNATPLLSTRTLAKYLKEDIPNIGAVARAVGVFDVGLAAGERKLLVDAAYVDPEFFDLFALEVVAGDAHGALATPGTVILTADAAARLFGGSPAVGSLVRVDNSWDAVVAAVIAPIRQPSFMSARRDVPLPFSMLAGSANARAASASNAQSAPGDETDDWRTLNGFTFASLPPTLSRAELGAQLAALADRRVPAALRQRGLSFEAFPVAEMTARRLNNALLGGSNLGFSATEVLLGLGILALVVACVSYANLASAQFAARAKEIGMRRVLGAKRRQLLTQCWTEALLTASVSATVALAAVVLASPVVERWTDVDVLFFLTRGAAPWGVVIGVVFAVAIGAGAYPALVLSRIPPLDAVQPGRSRLGPRLVARVLVGLQFAAASFLLIVVLVMQLESSALEGLAEPSHADPIVVLGNLTPQRISFATLETTLRRIPAVKDVAFVDATPWSSNVNVISFARSPGEQATGASVFFKNVSPDYFATLGLRVVAGRVFERDRDLPAASPVVADGSNNMLVVVDRTCAARLGFANPQDAVDQLLYPPGGLRPARIIGVTEPETTRLEATPVSGYAYMFAPQAPRRQLPLVRISREHVDATVVEIAQAWDKVAPDFPVNIRFVDQLFEERFRPYARTGGVLLFLAASALAVSSIGQLGIAVHAVRRRWREMGIRKTLGSSVRGLWRLLLTDLSKPVLLGNLAAWPFAYVAAQTYTQAFSRRVDLTAWPFLASLGITLVIASGVVGVEIWRAAHVRPVDVLRET